MWQTIDTAPKKGVYVLLFDPKSEDPIFVGYHRYRQWNPCFMENWGDHAIYPEPTHWMPLPSEGPYK